MAAEFANPVVLMKGLLSDNVALKQRAEDYFHDTLNMVQKFRFLSEALNYEGQEVGVAGRLHACHFLKVCALRYWHHIVPFLVHEEKMDFTMQLLHHLKTEEVEEVQMGVADVVIAFASVLPEMLRQLALMAVSPMMEKRRTVLYVIRSAPAMLPNLLLEQVHAGDPNIIRKYGALLTPMVSVLSEDWNVAQSTLMQSWSDLATAFPMFFANTKEQICNIGVKIFIREVTPSILRIQTLDLILAMASGGGGNLLLLPNFFYTTFVTLLSSGKTELVSIDNVALIRMMGCMTNAFIPPVLLAEPVKLNMTNALVNFREEHHPVYLSVVAPLTLQQQDALAALI